MGIWSTIGEAAATMNDDKDAAARFHQQKTDKHAALETNTHTILDDVKRLQERRASLPPGSPELAEIDKSLADHQKAFSDLYHPTKNPGAFQHLGRFLEKHVAKKEPAPLPQSNAVTPERLGQLQMGADKVTAGDPNLTPDEMRKKARVAAGLDPKAVPEKPPAKKAAEAGTPAEPKPVKTTSDERQRKDFDEWRKSHPEYKGTFERWRSEQSHLPKTPGAPKAERLSAAQNKAQSDFVEATKLAKFADQVAQHPNDAINQKRLAVSLERASAGRFTTQALEYIIKAGWGNSLQQWANNPSTGSLPADVMRQLIDGAHENVVAAKEGMDTAMALSAHLPANAGEAKKKLKGNDTSDDEFLKKF